MATPTWLGQMSSVCLRALERMDALFAETDDSGRPVAFGKVAGVVVTGNEDGAHNIVATVRQGLIDMGFNIPGQSLTYWHLGPGPGPDRPGPRLVRPCRSQRRPQPAGAVQGS